MQYHRLSMFSGVFGIPANTQAAMARNGTTRNILIRFSSLNLLIDAILNSGLRLILIHSALPRIWIVINTTVNFISQTNYTQLNNIIRLAISGVVVQMKQPVPIL